MLAEGLENSAILNYLLTEKTLDPASVKKLLSAFMSKSYKKGEHLLLKGQTEKRISFLDQGIVHQYRVINKKPVTINIAVTGMVFNSFTSYSLGMPSEQQQLAISDVTIYYLEKKLVDELIRSDHKFCYFYLKKQEEIHLERELRSRILQNKAADTRFKQFVELDRKADYYLNYVPNKLVASYLNLTPETLSREKSRYFA